MYIDATTLIKAYMKAEGDLSVGQFAKLLGVSIHIVDHALFRKDNKTISRTLTDALAKRYGGDFSFLLNEFKS